MTTCSVHSGKINRLANLLIPYTNKSNMCSKHAAMVISGGKPMSFGYNHDRMTSSGKIIMSYHAEVHALSNFMNNQNVSHLRNYMNDSCQCIAFRKKHTGSPIIKGAATI